MSADSNIVQAIWTNFPGLQVKRVHDETVMGYWLNPIDPHGSRDSSDWIAVLWSHGCAGPSRIISQNVPVDGSLREFYASLEIHFGRVGLQPCPALRVRAQSGTNTFGFTGHETYPIDAGIALMHAADLTGNGLNDLIVVNNPRGKIDLLYNQTGKTNRAATPRASWKSTSCHRTRGSALIPFPWTSTSPRCRWPI